VVIPVSLVILMERLEEADLSAASASAPVRSHKSTYARPAIARPTDSHGSRCYFAALAVRVINTTWSVFDVTGWLICGRGATQATDPRVCEFQMFVSRRCSRNG